jgi:hypothetical protein
VSRGVHALRVSEICRLERMSKYVDNGDLQSLMSVCNASVVSVISLEHVMENL